MKRFLITFLILVIPVLVLVELLEIKVLKKDGHIWVYQYEGERCLAFGIPIVSPRQTCFELGNEKKLVFEYQKFAMGALFLNPNPENILVIGLGGGALANALHYTLPSSQIDVVELDPKVIEVAKQYFNFSEDDKMKVFQTDGLDFVKECSHKYDLIILDAFDGEYIPETMLTEDFVLNVRRILNENGVVVVNTFGKSKHESLENDLYEKFFGDFYNFESHNRVIIAGKILNFDKIMENSRVFEKKFSAQNIGIEPLLEKFNESYRKKS
jgi:spermidine synthase